MQLGVICGSHIKISMGASSTNQAPTHNLPLGMYFPSQMLLLPLKFIAFIMHVNVVATEKD